MDVVVQRISRAFPYQFSLNSHAVILMRDRNTATVPNFENRFLNLDFFAE